MIQNRQNHSFKSLLSLLFTKIQFIAAGKLFIYQDEIQNSGNLACIKRVIELSTAPVLQIFALIL
jgi:hypothetical protein